MEKKLSVIIITKNEEKNIERTLQSLLWVDEIIIVDSFSTDKTKEITTKYPVNFIEREWKGFADQKKYALSKATKEWVLAIDADEVASEELKIEIQNMLKETIQYQAYFIPRKNYFLNKWIRNCGWYPDNQLRFGRRESLFVTDRQVHEGLDVNSEKGFLKGSLQHYSYNSIHQYFEKFNIYTTLDVEQKLIKKNNKIELYNLLFSPVSQFLRMYISKNGWKDGVHGLLVSLFSSFYTLVVYAKAWEKINSKK